MMEAALASYMPRIWEARDKRLAELEDLKENVRKDPEKVEQWLEKEIEKVRNIDADGLLDKVRSNTVK